VFLRRCESVRAFSRWSRIRVQAPEAFTPNASSLGDLDDDGDYDI